MYRNELEIFNIKTKSRQRDLNRMDKLLIQGIKPRTIASRRRENDYIKNFVKILTIFFI